MANSDIANKLYDMLKIKLGTESHTHSEIINEAKMLASLAAITLHPRDSTISPLAASTVTIEKRNFPRR